MKRTIVLLFVLMTLSLISGCFNQKATGTQQRWTDIHTATSNLISSITLNAQTATPDKNASQKSIEADYLSRARAVIDACQIFNEAIKAQQNINVDERLNAIAKKLERSSESLLTQTRLGLEALITAQQLSMELNPNGDPQKMQEISAKINKALNDTQSAQMAGAVILQQIGSHYKELEALRPILNAEYGFNLPQIEWIGQ